jgi:hypothetical protein
VGKLPKTKSFPPIEEDKEFPKLLKALEEEMYAPATPKELKDAMRQTALGKLFEVSEDAPAKERGGKEMEKLLDEIGDYGNYDLAVKDNFRGGWEKLRYYIRSLQARLAESEAKLSRYREALKWLSECEAKAFINPEEDQWKCNFFNEVILKPVNEKAKEALSEDSPKH